MKTHGMSLLLLFALLAPVTDAQESPSELVVVISDLHLGVGEKAVGEWLPIEDFRWGADFILFLDELHRLSNGRAVLVLAGDTFELWQSESVPCNGVNDDTGCSLAEALTRVRRVLVAHRLEMRSLGEFAKRGHNQVVFVAGNHDAAILHDDVWKEVAKATGINDDKRIVRAPNGAYIAPNRRIVVEHGHQWDEVNQFANWPKPWTIESGTTYFQRPWGEQLLRRFYDPIEQQFQVIDNFTGDLDGLTYGFAAKGFGGTSKELYRFIRMLVRDNSRQQIIHLLGDKDTPPVWDIAETRKKGLAFFVDSMQTDTEPTAILHDLVHANEAQLNDATRYLPVFRRRHPGALRKPLCDMDSAARFRSCRERAHPDMPSQRRQSLVRQEQRCRPYAWIRQEDD